MAQLSRAPVRTRLRLGCCDIGIATLDLARGYRHGSGRRRCRLSGNAYVQLSCRCVQAVGDLDPLHIRCSVAGERVIGVALNPPETIEGDRRDVGDYRSARRYVDLRIGRSVPEAEELLRVAHSARGACDRGTAGD